MITVTVNGTPRQRAAIDTMIDVIMRGATTAAARRRVDRPRLEMLTVKGRSTTTNIEDTEDVGGRRTTTQLGDRRHADITTTVARIAEA